MNIAFDIDGVIANTESAIRTEILKQTGHDIGDSLSQFDFPVPEYSKAEIYNMIQMGIENYTDSIKPYDGAIDAVNKIYYSRDKTRPITFITSRPESILKDETHDWLNKYFPTMRYKVIFASDKRKYILDNETSVFVEDRLKNANDISPIVTAVYLVNRSWNIGRDHAWNVIRVDSVEEAVDKFIGGEKFSMISRDPKILNFKKYKI